MKVLVTGGAGFIGCNFIMHMLKRYPNDHIVNVDSLTYAGNLESLTEIEAHPHYRHIQADITDAQAMDEIFQQGIDYVVNFAAESHVDRSIVDPSVFVRTNVLGTQVLLDAAKKYGVSNYVQISTDEVYGTLGDTGLFTESTSLAPNSPYSASKAAADLLVRAYHETYGLAANITRCSNNYGPYQFPEKLIPLMIVLAWNDKPLPVYGDGLNVRDWLHVEDHCSAIDLVMRQGISGEVYNIGGNNERTNIQIVNTLLDHLDKPRSLITYVPDRLGHDRRYGIDATKLRDQLGWEPKYHFEAGIIQTISWYLDHKSWWQRIQSGAYRQHSN